LSFAAGDVALPRGKSSAGGLTSMVVVGSGSLLFPLARYWTKRVRRLQEEFPRIFDFSARGLGEPGWPP
jgi:hypothetical protein